MSNEENYNVVISALRDSNIAEFQNIMSDKDILSTLLGRPTTTLKKENEINSLPEAKKARVLSAVSDILQAITSEAMTTSEMLEMLYTNYEESQVEEIAKFIKIVHSDYKVKGQNNKDIQISKTPFTIKYSEAVPQKVVSKGKKTSKYLHSSSYGLVKTDAVKDFHIANSKIKGSKTILESLISTTTKGQNPSPVKPNVDIFNVDTIVNKKIDDVDSSTAQTQQELSGEIEHVNKVVDGRILANKEDPSLAYILVDSADLRIGTRNTLELSTFFNMLSTVELSKCQPYFNAVFLLPGEVTNPASGKVFKTASITQFFDGTPFSDDLTSQNYKTLEASFVRVQKTREGKVDTRAVNTNMSAFTMPQTINRFDEVFVGHNENVKFFENGEFRRATSIHDYTRPFMTIKSFDIDVAPTQGLMSFKTGKLSLILHDRTRMTDIAPFIKPDLFGSFGAEIAIEYGWSHIDAGGKINYLGDFLNNSRVTEKYIITNSSFSMDNNGQINIDLSIAMRGPIDVKNVVIKSDPPGEISKQATKTARDNLKSNILSTNQTYKMNVDLSEVYSAVFEELSEISGSADQIKNAPFTTFKQLNKNYIRYKKRIKSTRKHDQLQTLLDNLFANCGIPQIPIQNNKKKSSEKSKSQSEEKKPEVSKDANKENAQSNATANNATQSTNASKPVVVAETTKKLTDSQVIKFIETFNNYYPKLIRQIAAVISYKKKLKNKTVAMLNKIVGGLDVVDPFYNKEWLRQYHRIIKKNSEIDTAGFDVIGIGGNDSTNYVTFGSFLTGLIGTHMTCTGKFDEIQIVSYTANEFCGLMSNLNVSSFLLPRVGLSTFLEELFQDGTSITIESLITQVIERFISTRLQICYGLADFYTRDAANITIVKSKSLRKDSKKLKTAINRQLAAIYTSLATNNSKAYTDEDAPSIDDVKFVMPKVKFTFDTITSKKSGYQRTICRLSIFDENDNPFGSVHSIMKKVYDEDGIVGIAAKLNRLRTQFKVGTLEKSIKNLKKLEKEKAKLDKQKGNSKETRDKRNKKQDEIRKTQIEISKIQQQIVKSDFYKRQGRIIDKLIREGKLVKINDETYKIVDNFQLSTIKNSLKNIMPSITYGSQNSAVIDASVTTVNEAKLNTVYLTRSDRNSGGQTQETRVQFQKDLPLRVLPSQASVTIFGCPFVNFAQYLFLDFETGTTVDNAYAVTGIKHSLSPGKFTTSLTLSYGDVYGKYENAAKTVQRAINDQNETTKLTDSDTQNDAEQEKVLPPIKEFTKNKPTEIKNAVSGVVNGSPSVVLNNSEGKKAFELNFKLNAFIYDSDVVAIDKKYKENKHTINLFHMFNYDKNKNKKVQVDLDLKKVDQAAYNKINEAKKDEIIKALKTKLNMREINDKIFDLVISKISNKKLLKLKNEKLRIFINPILHQIDFEKIYNNLDIKIALQYDVTYQDRKTFKENVKGIKIKAIVEVKDKEYKAIYSEFKKAFVGIDRKEKLNLIVKLTDKGIEIEDLKVRKKKNAKTLIPFEDIFTSKTIMFSETLNDKNK